MVFGSGPLGGDESSMRVHEGAALMIGLVAPGLLACEGICPDLSRISLLRALNRMGAGIKF